eukprot:TRINITY_DN12273_c0_g1_i1.p1 TRINITY_DN12273_c0_g1~~TRINITY_DN12273_c0_g1_i1.p1  ORF type:complete len:543 (+),score=60.58 TRINITY_DN12273_c0_g1_i1:73-1701(+)
MARRGRFFAIQTPNVDKEDHHYLLPPIPKFNLETLNSEQNEFDIHDRGSDIHDDETAGDEDAKNIVIKVVRSIASESSFTRTRDNNLKLRNWCMLGNALLCIILVLVMFQVEWGDGYDGYTWQPGQKSRIIKIIIATFTVFHIVQLIEYYKYMYIEKYHKRLRLREQRYKTRLQRESLSGRNYTYEPALRLTKRQVLVAFWRTFKRSNLLWKFVIELLILIPHPFIFLSWEHEIVDELGGLCVFLRLYVLLKVIRDHSAIHEQRKVIQGMPGYRWPTIHTLVPMKMLFYNYPITFLICWCLYFAFIISMGIYVFERNAQPDMFTFVMSFYLAVSSMATGWAADIYDEYDPVTWGGKFFALVGAILGLAIFALLIDYFHTVMRPSSTQQRAVEWVNATKLAVKEEDTAALLIQAVWKQYRWRQAERGRRKREKGEHITSLLESRANRIVVRPRIKLSMKKKAFLNAKWKADRHRKEHPDLWGENIEKEAREMSVSELQETSRKLKGALLEVAKERKKMRRMVEEVLRAVHRIENKLEANVHTK